MGRAIAYLVFGCIGLMVAMGVAHIAYMVWMIATEVSIAQGVFIGVATVAMLGMCAFMFCHSSGD